MSIKVINNIECTDLVHEAPRIITIKSCDKIPPFAGINKYIELEADNHTYRVLAKDIQDAILNATRAGE